MSYHLIVLCRRPPPSPPEGWPHTSEGVRFSAAPAGEWTSVAAEHLGCDALAVIESSRTDSGSEAHMRSRCCALADAGDGVVVERVPMLAFPRYRVVYRGAPTRPPPSKLLKDGGDAVAVEDDLVDRGSE